MNGQEGCIILVFDLPTLTKPQQKKRRDFISLIKKEGYTMIQESVYCKLIGNTKLSKDDKKRLIKNLSCEGSVYMMTLTKKQFESIEVLIGDPPNLSFEKTMVL